MQMRSDWVKREIYQGLVAQCELDFLRLMVEREVEEELRVWKV